MVLAESWRTTSQQRVESFLQRTAFSFSITKVEGLRLYLEKIFTLMCFLYAVMHCVGSDADCPEVPRVLFSFTGNLSI